MVWLFYLRMNKWQEENNGLAKGTDGEIMSGHVEEAAVAPMANNKLDDCVRIRSVVKWPLK
jgi:hypothetical protein